MADQRANASQAHTDGLRAWIGEVDRAIRHRSRLGVLLFAVIVCVSGVALYMAVQTSDDSVSKGEITALHGQIERLRGQVIAFHQLNRRTALARLSASRATAEVAGLRSQVRGLRQSAAAAKPASSRSHSPALPKTTAANKGSTSGAGKGSGAKSTTVSSANNAKLGGIIVDSHGLTLYDFHKDKGTKSACYGSCVKIWPPLTTSGGTPQAAGGAQQSLLGTSPRSDGTTQVTYGGHPLYTYVGDKHPGEATGNGLTEFGGSWHALRPNGKETGG
jgi:predicted lipoprotein with Yx(FWY)xxD motif